MKKILKTICLATFILIIFTGCGETGHKHISSEDAAKIIATEKNIIILDVRTQEEYDRRHIPNAILLPIEEIKKGNFTEKLPDKNQKILVYCWTGRRSEDSAKILAENGYKNIYDFGGLVTWEGEIEGEEINKEDLKND